MSIWEEIKKTRELLDITLKEECETGRAMNAAECKYHTVKALRVRELMEDGYSAAIINQVIKGDPKVAKALNEYQDFQVEYKNANEGVQVLKRDYDFLREQYKREWS